MSSSIRKKLEGKSTKLSQPRESLEDHPAAINNYADGSFYSIDINLIHPDPKQPRQFFDEEALGELSDSIRQKGVLQPVIIRKDEENKIWLVAGERRWRAARLSGLEKIPAILTTGNPAEISLIENIQRENLKPVEEAEAYARMVEEYGYTQEQLSQVVGKKRSTITESLSLNKLPEAIREECRRADNYPRRLLVEIAKQKTPEAMIDLFNQVKEGQLKSEDVRQISRKTRKEAIRRSAAAVALDRAFSLSSTLSKLDLNTANESEKQDLLVTLNELKRLIDNKFLA
jgi:ParB family chromosome partitioning protein